MKPIATRTVIACLAAMMLAVSCGAGSDAIGQSDQAASQVEAGEPSSSQVESPTSAPVATSVPASPAPPAPTEPTPAAPSEVEPTAVEIPPVSFPTGIKPVRISIPSIGVDAPTIDLSLAGLEPEVPSNFDDTGWYTQSREPGEIGPAIIAGHIDSRNGPAVFALLDQLQPGAEITVYDAEGESRTFIVTAGEQHPKGDLPPGVFGFDLPEPELRLITCGGTFDAESGHYRDNYIVYAVAA